MRPLDICLHNERLQTTRQLRFRPQTNSVWRVPDTKTAAAAAARKLCVADDVVGRRLPMTGGNVNELLSEHAE